MKKANCSYILKARTSIINKKTGELEFKAIEKKFENAKPLSARKEAFKFRNEFIYGMLTDIGLTDEFMGWDSKNREFNNLSDRDIRKFINPYLENDSNTEKTKIRYSDEIEDDILWEPPDDTLEWYASFNNGIWILFVHDDIELHWGENEVVIDKIVKYNGNLPIPPLYLNLKEEFDFYEKYGHEYEDFKITIEFFDDEGYLEGGEDELEAFKLVTILKTPFDWTGYNKPFWWVKNGVVEKEISIIKPQLPITMQEAFVKGECEWTEFKPVLTNNPDFDRDIEYEISKSLCAFLNSDGGYLFIGVNDKGKPYRDGINLRYKDQFLRDFTRIKAHFLPQFIAHTIYGDFYNLNSKSIFAITVFPSLVYPIFLRKKDKEGKTIKEFFVRSDAGSRHLYDIEEVVKYCFKKWK